MASLVLEWNGGQDELAGEVDRATLPCQSSTSTFNKRADEEGPQAGASSQASSADSTWKGEI